MKSHFYLLGVMLVLAGCNPFSDRQDAAKKAMQKADGESKQINRNYKQEVYNITPYQGYNFKAALLDPFRARDFVMRDRAGDEAAGQSVDKVKCVPPKCVPPEPHPKSLLEEFSLGTLSFVGTTTVDGKINALIDVPGYGVLPVKVGDFMGPNNGKVIEIRETAVILQEKIFKSGLWENQKKVLQIKQ